MNPALIVLGRSAAVASPWLLGAGLAVSVFTHLAGERDSARDRRGFLREVALNPLFTVDQLLFYRSASRPVREALRIIADPQTSEEHRQALRKAVANVL